MAGCRNVGRALARTIAWDRSRVRALTALHVLCSNAPVRRWREPLVLLVLFGAFTVWWLWPLPAVWRDHSAMLGERQETPLADFYLVTWVLAWDAHAIVTQPWALFQANAFYPSPSSLAYSEHLLGYLPLFAPTYWLTGNPILAVNVLVFLTYPLCALAAYALARRFTAPPAAALAGLLFAFAPFRRALPPHVHMLATFWLPLALLGSERWLAASSPRRRDAVLVAVALAMQGLSSVYLAYATAVTYGVYLPLALIRWRRRLDVRRLAGLGAALLAAALAIGLPMLPYLELRRYGLIPSYDDAASARPALGLLFAAPQVLDYLRATGIGAAGYALAALALLPPWRGRAWACVLGMVLTLVGLLLACGPASLLSSIDTGAPYRALVTWVPGFATVRIASRFVVIAHLGLALLAAVGVGRLLGRLRPPVAWAAAGVVALLFAWSFRTLPPLTVAAEVAGGAVPELDRWLADHGRGRALLELPAAKRFPRAAHRMLMSTHHWLPIVEGYSGYPPPSTQRIYLVASELPNPRALQQLVDLVDIGWIVVHLDELAESERRRWDAPPPGLTLVGRFGDALLFDVELKPGPGDRRRRFFSTTETIAGTPLAPLGDACPGRLVLTAPLPETIVVGQSLVAKLDVYNDGAEPLPAQAMYPRHLVMLHAEVRAVEATPARATDGPRADLAPRHERARLILDVPAHGKMPAQIVVPLPPVVGDYVVRLELVQVEDGPLARCGFATIEAPIRVVHPSTPPQADATGS